jgi:addiction module RelB/DinJ family antitoxin
MPIIIIDEKVPCIYYVCMKTVMSVKIDDDVKQSAQEVAKSAGLTLSALINSYLTQVAATRRIELYAPEPMTPRLEGLIAEVEAELATDSASPAFSNAEDFLADLKK